MHTALRRGVGVASIAGGFLILGLATASTATADTGTGIAGPPASTSGADGLLSGNQTDLDLGAPVTIDRQHVTVGGDDNQQRSDAPSVASSGTSSGTSSDAPSDGPADAAPAPASTPAPAAPTGDATGGTTGEDGTGSGNQTSVTACVPVTVSGNQVTLVGEDNESSGSSGAAGCETVGTGGFDLG